MDEPCQKKPMQIIWGGQAQLIQNEFLCCDNRCISGARLREILRTLGTAQLPIGTAGVFPSTLSYHCFYVPNWVCKRPGAFSHDEDMKKSAGGLESTVSPPVDPGQSLGGGPRGEAPGSSAYLGFENLIL